MNIEAIALGTKLEINIFDNRGIEKKPSYISQLEEILNNGDIVIGTPIQEGKIIPVSLESKIKITFFHSKGIFTFTGRIIDRAKRGNIFVLRVGDIGTVHRIQRREYFRFECLIPVKFRIVQDRQAWKPSEDSPYIDALMRDISGGGIGLLTKQRYNTDLKIELQISLDDKDIKTFGKIVRSIVFDQEPSMYDTGVCFQGISIKDRDSIIKFIFQRQRKLRQKGLV